MNNIDDDLMNKVNAILIAMNDISSKNWLRTKEAADYLGISITQIHTLKRNGILPFSKIGGSIYFKRQDIDEILEENREGGNYE
ncbi:MAG: helix-turn-helix domain-containing protein [Balneolaceae bacterium]